MWAGRMGPGQQRIHRQGIDDVGRFNPGAASGSNTQGHVNQLVEGIGECVRGMRPVPDIDPGYVARCVAWMVGRGRPIMKGRPRGLVPAAEAVLPIARLRYLGQRPDIRDQDGAESLGRVGYEDGGRRHGR